MGIFLRPAPTQGSTQAQWVDQATDRDSSTKKGCDIGGRLGAMTHLGMISYQGPAGACDGRAQVTLGYRSRGQSDWGQADYIRTKWQEDGLTALSSCPTTNTDLLHIIKMSPGWARQKYYRRKKNRFNSSQLTLSPRIWRILHFHINVIRIQMSNQMRYVDLTFGT